MNATEVLAAVPSTDRPSPGAAEAFVILEQLAAERATGALRAPGGAVHLADGLVVHADSERAPGLAALLTGCGRITPEAWRQTVRAFGPQGRVGSALVEQRRLSRGELEICQLAVLYDAAYFVLDPAGPAAGPWTFEPGVRHWLGPVVAVSARRLRREVERRCRLLERIWPWPLLDTAPVRRLGTQGPCQGPVARAGRPGPPSRRQRELLDHADGRRTPAELARLLGRSAFATTADVRRLAAAGLLATPGRSAPRHAAAQPSAAVGMAQAGPRDTVPARAGSVGAAPGQAAPGQAGSVQTPPGHAPPARTGGGLHRRVPGAALAGLLPPGATRSAHPSPSGGPPTPAHPPTPAAAHPLTVPDPDIALLTRVRTLLEARL
ncbi:hypothetical protein ACFVHB_17390 [Kitasatospora sp. NPDC127111]|uniref:hypothetical protein n=1 Tax=Kitasatospora sp. NPDC127111 TaxID=3345363 RepID=UPI0036324BEC